MQQHGVLTFLGLPPLICLFIKVIVSEEVHIVAGKTTAAAYFWNGSSGCQNRSPLSQCSAASDRPLVSLLPVHYGACPFCLMLASTLLICTSCPLHPSIEAGKKAYSQRLWAKTLISHEPRQFSVYTCMCLVIVHVCNECSCMHCVCVHMFKVSMHKCVVSMYTCVVSMCMCMSGAVFTVCAALATQNEYTPLTTNLHTTIQYLKTIIHDCYNITFSPTTHNYNIHCVPEMNHNTHCALKLSIIYTVPSGRSASDSAETFLQEWRAGSSESRQGQFITATVAVYRLPVSTGRVITGAARS